MNASFFLSPSFLASVVVLVFAVVFMWKFTLSGLKLHVASRTPGEKGKQMEDQAKKDVQRVTLGLLFVLATFVCIYTMYMDLANNKIDLNGLGLSTAYETCTPPAVAGKGYTQLEPCFTK